MSEAHIGKRAEVVKIPDAEKILSMGEDRIRELLEGLSGEDLKKAKKNLKEALKSLPQKEQEYWGKYVSEKGFTKRNFLKLIGAAVATLGVAAVVKELFGEKGEEKEEEVTVEKKKEPEKEFDIEKASSIELVKRLSEYPKAIKESEKQTPKEFANDLAKKEFDSLIVGGVEPRASAEKAVEILEELIKNGKKISVIGFEGLSYTDDEHLTAIKRFRSGEPFGGRIYSYVRGKEDLVKLAETHSIEIVGLEKGKGKEDYRGRRELDRFKDISERVGEIMEKKKDGIAVISIRQEHATTDGWENKNLLAELNSEKFSSFPAKEEALENNLTIKEYLKKKGLKAIVIQVEPWKYLTDSVDSALDYRYDRLPPEDRKTFVNVARAEWKNYILEEKDSKDPFVAEHPTGEDTFVMVIPYDVPDLPPFFKDRLIK